MFSFFIYHVLRFKYPPRRIKVKGRLILPKNLQNLHTIFRISIIGGNSLHSFVYSGLWLEFFVDFRDSRVHY